MNIFDIHRDVYSKICHGPVRNYLYDLEVSNSMPSDEMTPEKLADIEFRNHVYEMSFQEVEKIQKEAFKQRIIANKLKK